MRLLHRSKRLQLLDLTRSSSLGISSKYPLKALQLLSRQWENASDMSAQNDLGAFDKKRRLCCGSIAKCSPPHYRFAYITSNVAVLSDLRRLLSLHFLMDFACSYISTPCVRDSIFSLIFAPVPLPRNELQKQRFVTIASSNFLEYAMSLLDRHGK